MFLASHESIIMNCTIDLFIDDSHSWLFWQLCVRTHRFAALVMRANLYMTLLQLREMETEPETNGFQWFRAQALYTFVTSILHTAQSHCTHPVCTFFQPIYHVSTFT